MQLIGVFFFFLLQERRIFLFCSIITEKKAEKKIFSLCFADVAISNRLSFEIKAKMRVKAEVKNEKNKSNNMKRGEIKINENKLIKIRMFTWEKGIW